MKKLITYLFPIYNEEDNINHLYEIVNRTTIPLVKKYDLEILFVNDGSKDSSLAKLLAIQKIDKRVRIIDFARNFGHQVAVTAGIDHAKGDALVIMDADLQDPPSVSLELIEKWEQGYDVVYAQRRSRKDTFFKKLTAYLF
jgi:dolichol-phosphate mannosyltransferase